MAGKRTLVSFGSNGFTDYVVLPDGRSFNMGSVSILKFVTELAQNSRVARKALDQFLSKNKSSLAVDLDHLQVLLTPKKARWATLDKPLMVQGSQPLSGEVDLTLFEQHLARLEANVAKLAGIRVGSDFAYPLTPVFEAIAESTRALVAACEPCEEEKQEQAQKTASVDQVLKRELELFMDNESRLNTGRKAVLKSLIAKIKSGTYNSKVATKEWLAWVDDGAKAYCREFGGDPLETFPKALREKLAEDLSSIEGAALMAGDYGDIPKLAAGKEAYPENLSVSDNTVGSEEEDDTQEVNASLVSVIKAKIDRTLPRVLAKKASAAHTDLHRISSTLAHLVSTTDLAHPSVRPVLLDLTRKADHVYNHFAR